MVSALGRKSGAVQERGEHVVLDDFRQLEKELERPEFRFVVPDFRLNKALDRLAALPAERKGKVEFLCNEACWFDCPDRKACYENVSRKNLGEDCEDHICVSPYAQRGYDVGENVFEPLGITAAYSAGLLPDPENIPYLYNTDGSLADSRAKSTGKPWDEEPDPDRHYRITVGSLWMRPADLCRIGMMLCNEGKTGGKRLLQPETVCGMMDEQCGKGGITARTPYGLCVHHESTLVKGKTFYGHQGLSDGILCSVYYDPETRFVFVLCSNGCHNMMDNRVAHLTRKVFEIAWKAFGEKRNGTAAREGTGGT